MCGIGAIVHSNNNINAMLYEILLNLQHRGQDSCGIITYDKIYEQIYEQKEFGLVENTLLKLKELDGQIGIGHVRYPTHGIVSKNEIQPFYDKAFSGISLVHNGNIVNVEYIRNFLNVHNIQTNSTSDSELILKLFIYILKQKNIIFSELSIGIMGEIVKQIYKICRGSYSIIIMINNFGLIAFRDIYGIRPLVYCHDSEYVVIASETIALPMNSYSNIDNGEVIVVKNNEIFKHKIYNYSPCPCLFEYIYFARPESYINDVLVYEFREKLAEKLLTILERSDLDLNDIDCVIPIPQTGLITAVAIGQLLKKPIKQAVVKNRYTHRTFINADREKIINNIKKIRIIQKLVFNKNVLVVDDSIVRGNTSKYIISELRRCGVNKIFFVSCCPPIQNPNMYGIAIPSYNELIAHNKTEEEVRKALNVDRLFYIDLNALCTTLTELNPNLKHFETSVFTGIYITESHIP